MATVIERLADHPAMQHPLDRERALAVSVFPAFELASLHVPSKEREHLFFKPPALNRSIFAGDIKKAGNAECARYAGNAHAAKRHTRNTHAE
jgi:hypothetical protein